MGDFDIGGGGSRGERGFNPPYDISPVQVPRGWHGGGVARNDDGQAVRRWSTVPDGILHRAHDARPGRPGEAEVSYGTGATVSAHWYRWLDSRAGVGGWYTFSGAIESRDVRENTDDAKARAALELMRKHSDKTR